MPKILIIDDEKSIRASLKEILTYEKFEVDEAADGAEGLKKAESGNYDVILCDIKMPKVGHNILPIHKDRSRRPVA